MRSRTLAREIALQLLYERDATDELAQERMDSFSADRSTKPEVREYACMLVSGVLEHMREFDEEFEHLATLVPDSWWAPAATGSPERCVEKIRGQLDLGCDGVILHGASPAELEPILQAYRKVRPTGRFDGLAANPAGQ